MKNKLAILAAAAFLTIFSCQAGESLNPAGGADTITTDDSIIYIYPTNDRYESCTQTKDGYTCKER